MNTPFKRPFTNDENSPLAFKFVQQTPATVKPKQQRTVLQPITLQMLERGKMEWLANRAENEKTVQEMRLPQEIRAKEEDEKESTR